MALTSFCSLLFLFLHTWARPAITLKIIFSHNSPAGPIGKASGEGLGYFVILTFFFLRRLEPTGGSGLKDGRSRLRTRKA